MRLIFTLLAGLFLLGSTHMKAQAPNERCAHTSYEEYLESVVGGPALVEQTIAAIMDIESAMENLPQGRLSDHVDSQEVKTLRDQLQSNTANFKSSLSSLLGISITFNSGDGD